MPKLPPNHIAAYGTLREGHYNYDRYKDKADQLPNRTFQKVNEGIVEGYQLWDLGPYPYIVKTGDRDDKIIVDVIETDLNTLQSISMMEIGAGYNVEEVNVNGTDCLIYVYPRTVTNSKQIESGDYNNK